MREIVFATSNQGKVKTLARRLDSNKYKIIQENIDIPEVQADHALEIATRKAHYAFDLLQKPVIVQDSSFHITALKGFPGPYIKYINQTIGSEGLLKLLENTEDRSAYFEVALVFVDEKGETHPFVNIAEKGSIASYGHSTNSDSAWSDLWKIYIPPHYTKTLAEFTSEELKQRDMNTQDNSEFAQFIRWLEDQG